MLRDKDELKAKNVIDFEKHRIMRNANSLTFLQIYAVRANPLTGEWVEEPYPTGEAVTSETWASQEDLSDIHFTTFEKKSLVTGKMQTCGLMVNWLPIKEDEA